MKNRIAELRKLHGITQGELAEAVGVIRQTITSLENYRFYPTLELAIKISRHFQMTVEEVFIYEGEVEDE